VRLSLPVSLLSRGPVDTRVLRTALRACLRVSAAIAGSGGPGVTIALTLSRPGEPR
jgi:hypothetical protein